MPSTMLFPLLFLATQTTSTKEICEELAACPTVQEFGAQKIPARVEQMTDDLTKRMWRLLPRTTEELRDALKEAFRQREVEKRTGTPESWRTKRMIGAQVWIDRFLFDPPGGEQNAKTFFSFALLPNESAGSSSPQLPTDIEDESARIFPSLCRDSDPEPVAPEEFEYYAEHYPRRQLDLTPTNVEYLRLKSVIDRLDGCPILLSMEWIDAGPAGRQRLFRKVEAIMATLQDIPTDTLKRALDWFGRRKRRMWKVIGESYPLKRYLEQFPLNSPGIEAETDQAYFRRLFLHAGDVPRVEFWVDRFLFQAPEYERVTLLKNNRYPWMNRDTNWNTLVGEKEIGELAPRMWPVQFQGGAFTFDEPKFYGGNNFADDGLEFAYYSNRFPRRTRW